MPNAIKADQSDPSDLIISKIDENGVLRLTLNDTKRRNPLSLAMIKALETAFDEAQSNKKVRVIILAHKGPAFCAGHDLKELTTARTNEDRGRAFFEKTMKACSDLMQKIVAHPKPVIAEISGIATAAGCQLVASCDLAIAAKSARFVTPGVHIGLFCSTPMVALSRSVARKHAMEMLLTGEAVSAKKAKKIGLVNQVVKAGVLEAKSNALATKIAQKSSLTLKIGKSAFYRQAEMNLNEAYDFAAKTMTQNMLARDAEEGITAFIEKRSAQWRDE